MKKIVLSIVFVFALVLSACTQFAAPTEVAQPLPTAMLPVEIVTIPEDVAVVSAPVAAPVVEVELHSICDSDLVGAALNNITATEFTVSLPASDDYKYLLASMDNGVIVYNGTNTDTVKGALIFSTESFKILTHNGVSGGLGWNEKNEKFNMHVCALPVAWDEVATWRDWQFGNDNGAAGEHKPVGILINNGSLGFIWNSSSFTLTEFDALLK